ncbi:MAG: DsbA family protein [Acidimicrobiaceae bacterium]|nr:DsbA family protein [Acidimicrobiaceae bacterium]
MTDAPLPDAPLPDTALSDASLPDTALTDTSPAGGGEADISVVDFHFDVICPWAYQTSKWIREVRRQNGLRINWRFFSLEEVNRFEGKKHPWERPWSYGWSLMRIGALLRRESMDHLDAWYERSARALHEQGLRVHEPDVARQLLQEIGLDPGVVDAALDDPTSHDEVRDEHDRVVASGGFGVPTLFFGEQALFGPVLIDPPGGAEALELWDAVTAWLRYPRLYEIQRPKSQADENAIAEVFRPYLEARDWVSINRGEVFEFKKS